MVDAIVAERMKTEQKATEIKILKTEISNIYKIIGDLEKKEETIWGQKKNMIRDIALNYERLHELGDYADPINTICNRIKHDIVAQNLWTDPRYVYQVLESKYKMNQDYDRSSGGNGNGKGHPDENSGLMFGDKHIVEGDQSRIDPQTGDPLFSTNSNGLDQPRNESHFFSSNNSESSFEARLSNRPPLMPPAHLIAQEDQQKRVPEMPLPGVKMTKEQIQEGAEYYLREYKRVKEWSRELGKRKDLFLEKAIEHHIAIDPELVNSSMYEEQISTRVPGESGPSEFSREVHAYADDWHKVGEKIEKFKPSEEDSRKWAASIRFMRQIIKPWTDEKWAEDSFGWFRIQLTNIAHGKHAAAKMNEIIVREGVKRALTREQVGDAMERVIMQNLKYNQALEDWCSCNLWYEKLIRPPIGGRRDELGPRLSEKSLG